MQKRKKEGERRGKERKRNVNFVITLARGVYPSNTATSRHCKCARPFRLPGRQPEQRRLTCKPLELNKKQMNKCWCSSRF